jgi:Sigma-70, region 4
MRTRFGRIDTARPVARSEPCRRTDTPAHAVLVQPLSKTSYPPQRRVVAAILNHRSRRAPRCERARSVLKEALAALSPDQREVLLLDAWGGLSHAEITEALSVQAPSAANAFTAPARRPPNDDSPRVRVSSAPVLPSSVVTLAVCCYEAGVIVVRWL